MAIVRWDPYKDLMSLRERFDRFFEDLLPAERELFEGEWSPRADIRETEKAMVIDAELPGVQDKDIDISVQGNTLILRGEREREKDTKKENYHRIERSYGSFYRSFMLPSYVDFNRIEAKHVDGLLRITIPKKAELKPKKVKVLPRTEAKK
jgi:HSP20 family protein